MEFSFQTLSASAIILCILVFATVTSWSMLRARSITNQKQARKETEHSFEEVVSGSIPLSLVIAGTLAFAVMILLYIFLALVSRLDLLEPFSLQALIPFGFVFQYVGLLLLASGFLFFTWSIVVRARAFNSTKLVTWGPFRIVRHPSYFSYFLMFIGLFLLWANMLTLLPFAAVPGYVAVTSQEEAFLAKQFGKQYLQYQMRTGRLFPKLVHRKRKQASALLLSS